MKSLKEILSKRVYPCEDIQRIFVLVKPGSLDHSQYIIEGLEKLRWKVCQTRVKILTLKEAHKLYEPHKKESFYKDLCNYMISGPCRAFIFCREGRMTDKVFNEINEFKKEVRDKFGESEMRNVMHSSDSMERVEIESNIFF